jgi:hypothetical protein
MKKTISGIFIALLLTAGPWPGIAEDRLQLKAIVSWSGHGQLFQTGTDEQEFLGSLDGVMFIETSEGTLNEAFVECTARRTLDRGESKTAGSGKCTIVQSSEDSVFANYDCTGELGACAGTFTITGGTGKFKGISGSSPMTMRSPLRHLVHSMTSAEEVVVRYGVMILLDLNYTIAGGRK